MILKKPLLLLLLLQSLWAGDEAVLEFKRFNFVFENDGFFRIDRWYTAGVDLSFLYKANNRMVAVPFVDHTNTISYLSFALSLEMYTPASHNRPEPGPNDRPYAGWLYGSFGLHESNEERLDSLELQLGVVGPSAQAEAVQRFIHYNIIGDPVDGWQNQLHDELGVNLAYHHQRRYTFLTQGFESLLIPRLGGVIGNVRTEFDTGLLYRVGIHLPKDFGQNFMVTPGLDSSIPAQNRNTAEHLPRFSYYLQLQADLRFVGRDLFLEGNSDGDSLSVDPYPLVARAGGGLGGSYRNYQLSVIYTAETKSFTQQTKIHGYGSLLFTYSY